MRANRNLPTKPTHARCGLRPEGPSTPLPDPARTPVLTVPEAARLLRVSRGLAYQAVRSGQLPSIRIGNRRLIPTAKLLAFLIGEPVSAKATG